MTHNTIHDLRFGIFDASDDSRFDNNYDPVYNDISDYLSNKGKRTIGSINYPFAHFLDVSGALLITGYRGNIS